MKEHKYINQDGRFTDTRIGTDSEYEFSNGNTLPLLGSPHANNYFAVQTNGEKGGWWFNPGSNNFEGFRLTHQPSPWMGDFSTFLILPAGEVLKKRSYDPDESIFLPHINQIVFDGGDYSNITAYDQVAVIDYFSEKKAGFIIRGEGLFLEKQGANISGHVVNFSGSEDENLKMYISIGLDKDFNFEEVDGAYFINTGENTARLSLSTSFISLEQAKSIGENNRDFDKIYENSKTAWQKYFDKFEIDHKPDLSAYQKYEKYNKLDQVKFFYHCVYRAFLFPMKFYERDFENKEFYYDTSSKQVKEGKLFTNMGLWDLQKTLFPLLSLVDVDLYEDILEGFLNTYMDAGFLPKWLSPDERGLMPGTLVDNVIADASGKNIGLQFMEKLLEAMIKSAEKSSPSDRYGRLGAEDYRKYGYIPSDYHESVNQTIDNTISDFSISVVARNLGYEDLAKKYETYSKNYKNLYDKKTSLLRAKDRFGNFETEFDPLNWGSPYTEGSSYQNSYNMYHDIGGLVELVGGKRKFEDRLDFISNSTAKYKPGAYGYTIHEMREFEAARFGQIAISNQPSFHIPYLYYYVDRPFKTQLIVKELLLNYFFYDFNGFPGDEDNGSMAAWYIFSSLGFYPLAPASGEYIFGMPFWDHIKVHLSNGKILDIRVKENYHHKKYIDWIRINDRLYHDRKISHKQILSGEKIEIKLGIVPKI